MANDKRFVVKNGLTAQNISFVDDTTTATNTISVSMLTSDTVSFSGDSGQLFSITDSLTGTIFAVNDISGIPSIEVDDDGTIRFAEFSGNILIGTATDDGSNKLQVSGNTKVTGNLEVTGTITGTASNANLLDNLDSTQFLRSDAADSWNSTLTYTGTINSTAIDVANSDIINVNKIHMADPGEGIHWVGYNSSVQQYVVDDANDNIMTFDNVAEIRRSGNKVWDAGNDGSGSGLDADTLDGRQLNTLVASLRANHNLTGGGTITYNASRYLKNSARIIVIANGRGSFFSTSGFFDINIPTSGTITGVGGSANRTATADGIQINVWEALYYILPIGSGSGSVAANFRVATYTSDVEIPDTWVLIAIANGDTGQKCWVMGKYGLEIGESIDTTVYDAKNADTVDGIDSSSFLRSDANDDFSGTLNYTPDTGTVIAFDGQAVIRRLSANGGLAIGHDDALILGAGEAADAMVANLNAANETVYIGAEGGVTFYSFPNNDTTWANRKEMTYDTSGNLTVPGRLNAITKSFVIDHPTKLGMKLRHGSLEGPENGVYIRGRLTQSNTIELPDYWTGLVNEDSITVNLTPIGKRHLWVETIENNSIIIGCDDAIDCYFTVFAERKDVDKLVVEYVDEG